MLKTKHGESQNKGKLSIVTQRVKTTCITEENYHNMNKSLEM